MNNSKSKRIRQIVLVFLVTAGIVFVVLAMAADDLGFDITPGFGVIQMVSFLFGLTFLTLAVFGFVYSRRTRSAPSSLQAQISTRLIATGLVLAYVTGLSDLIGIGTHVEPSFNRPYIGPLQLGGILIGIALIIVGLVLYHTSRGQRPSSSLGFLVNGRDGDTQE